MFSKNEAEDLVLDLSDWFGSDLDAPLCQAAILLLLGIGRRKHLDDLTKVSKYPREFVKARLKDIRAARIWRGEDKITYANWCDDPFSFALDVMVAEGRLVKVYDKTP